MRNRGSSIAAAVTLALVGTGWLGARRQRRNLARHLHRLEDDAAASGATPVVVPVSLPPPVERYLRWALGTQESGIRIVRLRQAGTLRTDVRSDRWMTFRAEHIAAPGAIGFLWNARVTIAPLLHVRVRDAYLEGEGSGHVSLMSAVVVASDAATPEMNSGSLHRFLAEAVWYPTALLPGPHLSWTAIDAQTALATLTDGSGSVTLEFRFADTGEVTGIYTPARWGSFDEGYAQRPWEGHFRNYQLRDGLRVPLEGDVGWYVGGRWRPVWKATITAFDAA